MREIFRRFTTATIDLLLPPVCNFCGAELPQPGTQPLLCGDCRVALQNVRGPACPACASPLSPVPQGDGCPRCHERRFAFASAFALGIYRDSLREAVIRMKQRAHEALALSIGHLLAITMEERGRLPECDLLVPVPTHWTKRWLRGHNAPDLIGEALGARRGIPFRRDALRLLRRTRKQGTLLPSERRKNVRGAYAISAGYDLRSARILLLDDIMTTGATADEAARVLVRGGAAEVNLVVIARGVGMSQRSG